MQLLRALIQLCIIYRAFIELVLVFAWFNLVIAECNFQLKRQINRNSNIKKTELTETQY